MKRFLALILALCLCCGMACAGIVTEDDEGNPAGFPVCTYSWTGHRIVTSYTSDTLVYTIETMNLEGCMCYVTKVWVKEPGRQIRKATAHWEEDLKLPLDMAESIEGCALAVNGSGYVSPTFPEIPDNYPGSSPDYYYTPLGSVTVTDGVVFRNLSGVPYYGLTLQDDGLQLHVGEDPEAVLAQAPLQTWSFYVECPLIQNGVSILDREWVFANRHAARTIIARMDANNYVLITATGSVGLTLLQATDFLLENFAPEWAYDLDGGPSSALIYRKPSGKKLHVIYGGKSKDADLMGFTE